MPIYNVGPGSLVFTGHQPSPAIVLLVRDALVDPRRIYQQGYCKPLRPPHPRKWRGPRLRLTHKRPSAVPRRYRVNFNRITP